MSAGSEHTIDGLRFEGEVMSFRCRQHAHPESDVVPLVVRSLRIVMQSSKSSSFRAQLLICLNCLAPIEFHNMFTMFFPPLSSLGFGS